MKTIKLGLDDDNKFGMIFIGAILEIHEMESEVLFNRLVNTAKMAVQFQTFSYDDYLAESKEPNFTYTSFGGWVEAELASKTEEGIEVSWFMNKQDDEAVALGVFIEPEEFDFFDIESLVKKRMALESFMRDVEIEKEVVMGITY